ncbi:hypothetical protein LSUB1_G004870 [Lachnellula subtilissima]|uniref:N-acetylgalactosaminide beta-1,3-galactosyltransferase n=1 Tax=Lachnellula subtilissima TaxID=602034 RepID=A0A8H8RRS3_9HELO|nr:hypothetical protein LSUB1_G004870 [Lachnellula subtilissima]
MILQRSRFRIYQIIGVVLLLQYFLFFHGSNFTSFRNYYSTASPDSKPVVTVTASLVQYVPSPETKIQDLETPQTASAEEMNTPTTSIESPKADSTSLPPCPPGLQNVVIGVKTGASEAESKIPALMTTSLRCAQHVLLFSDLEQDIGPYHLHDSLDAVSPSITDNNRDFDLYFKQKELWETKQDISELAGIKHPEDPDVLAAWTLDKYKFVHMLEKMWVMKPDMDWYVQIDGDTYVVMENLLLWLETLDPTKKSYIGSEVLIADYSFAHGGSGALISNALMSELAHTNGTAARWDVRAKKECCGDLVLSFALGDFGTGIQNVAPVINGERPGTVPYGPLNNDYWCKPAVTFHHVTAEDTAFLADIEMKRRRLNKPGPLTYTELFYDHVIPSLPPYRDNWDNQALDQWAGGREVNAGSFDECAQLCYADEECLQYTHHGNMCRIAKFVRFGIERKADEDGMWRSGWHRDRLADWASRQPDCDRVTFPEQRYMDYSEKIDP